MLEKKLIALIGLSIASLAGCTSNPTHPQDPLEKVNREIYGFNRAIDKGIMRPIAYVYYAYSPKELQSGVHNFFQNFSEPLTVINDVLQAKFAYAVHDTSRFVINSTVGLGGLFDVAQQIGLEPRQEDFGQTLYAWGYKNSSYLMIPLMGPSTVRDGIGYAVDSLVLNPWIYIDEDEWLWALYGLYRLDNRAYLLRGERLLETVGVDEYAFVRDVYFQKRTYAFYDGNIPETEENNQKDPFAEPGFS